MKYKAFDMLEDMLRHCYCAVDLQHATSKDDDRFEFGAGDWANPIDIGETNEIAVRQIAKPAGLAYIFAKLLDEWSFFTVALSKDKIVVERITREKALELEAND